MRSQYRQSERRTRGRELTDGIGAHQRSRQSAILAVQKSAHRLPTRFVRFLRRLALVGVHAALSGWSGRFGSTALRALVREAGLVRLQFKLFPASAASFNRKTHFHFMIRREGARRKWAADLKHNYGVTVTVTTFDFTSRLLCGLGSYSAFGGCGSTL